MASTHASKKGISKLRFWWTNGPAKSHELSVCEMVNHAEKHTPTHSLTWTLLQLNFCAITSLYHNISSSRRSNNLKLDFHRCWSPSVATSLFAQAKRFQQKLELAGLLWKTRSSPVTLLNIHGWDRHYLDPLELQFSGNLRDRWRPTDVSWIITLRFKCFVDKEL